MMAKTAQMVAAVPLNHSRRGTLLDSTIRFDNKGKCAGGEGGGIQGGWGYPVTLV